MRMGISLSFRPKGEISFPMVMTSRFLPAVEMTDARFLAPYEALLLGSPQKMGLKRIDSDRFKILDRA
jgi:hypothetical protein